MVVSPGSIQNHGGSSGVEFDVHDGGAKVHVKSSGVPPQMFRENIGVVVLTDEIEAIDRDADDDDAGDSVPPTRACSTFQSQALVRRSPEPIRPDVKADFKKKLFQKACA